MKKGLFLCLLLSIVSIIHAEQLKFVTVLSSPVGTFNKLEEVDPSKSVQSPVINFCTSIGQEGKVVLRGNKQPNITTLNLSAGTTLGGDGQNYILNSLTMKDGGTLKGSRLLANTVQINNLTVGKSENLYTNNLTVAGAKTETLDINNGESKIKDHHDATEMVWSNQYKTDNACGADCAKQYLLKQNSTGVPSEPERNIVCTRTSAVGPCALDNNGNPSYYWQNFPLCADVGGVSGGSFEGTCIMLQDCSFYKVTGKLDITEIPPVNGQMAVQCKSSYAYNDCGDYNQMWGDVWYSFSNASNATSTCQSFCTPDSLKEGRCTIKGVPTQSNRCIVYSSEFSSCRKYTLTCTVSNEHKKQAWRYECKKV